MGRRSRRHLLLELRGRAGVALQVAVPRVRRDGAAAQWQPACREEGIAAALARNELAHLMLLRGRALVSATGLTELWCHELSSSAPVSPLDAAPEIAKSVTASW